MKRIDWSELRPQISLVWRLSMPAILTQITTIAMQYIDSAMVGALGANASAAIGLVSTSTWLLSGITYAITAGFSVQVAHHIGAKRDEDARTVVKHGLISALLISTLLCALGAVISDPLPVWLGGSETIHRDVFAVQRGHGNAQHTYGRNVHFRHYIQCDFHSQIRRIGRGHRHGACLRGGMPCNAVVLLRQG